LAPTSPIAADASFAARSVRLPRIRGVTKKALDETQASELASVAVLNLTDAVAQALDDCPIGADGQILCPINRADTCDLGGRVEVQGNWSGSIDSAGAGVLLLDSTETLTDCQFDDGVVANGDPALTLTATIKTDGSGTFQFGGGIKWVERDGTAGACQVSVTAIIDATGAESDSGTICGIDVNALI
jgi:hypothetical protein